MTEKHNGWTNYATWRIKLEIFDDYDSSIYPDEVTADEIKQTAEEHITQFGEHETGFAVDYAMAFIAKVNWYEIAESINELVRENK